MGETNYEYALMEEEISNFKEFQERHRRCNPKARSAMLEEDMAPTYCTITLEISTIGMSPSAKCLVCGKTESIICNKRIDML